MFNILQVFNWLGKSKASDINIMTANDYYSRIKMIALSLFEWEGLPESCNARYLEDTLFRFGKALFVKDPEMEYLTVRCAPYGLNVYDEPLSFETCSTGYTKHFTRENSVFIRNNYLERPTDFTVVLFATRLSTAERTIDVNVNAQKTPVLLRCDDKDKTTIEKIYDKYEGNEPVILGGKNLNTDGITVFKTDAPYVVDKLQVYKKDIWNEVYTFFGLNNANTEKRERLITDEVNANNEVISINADAMLLTRQQACREINEKYRLNVSVKMRGFIEKDEDVYARTEGSEE